MQKGADKWTAADFARAQVEAQKTQTNALLERQKLMLDAYRADTERMKALFDISMRPRGMR
jgi:hypothetical protein